MANSLQKKLLELADPVKAEHAQRFFKTGAGDYGEGDCFLGIRTPVLRQQAKRFQELSLSLVEKSLRSKCHEERHCALLILVLKFQSGDEREQLEIYQLYLANTAYINNWDLVDCSAHYIVGAYLLQRDRQILYQLAVSKNLWERRIAMIATWLFIRENDLADVIRLAEVLLDDSEDLMHKAVGWMLREMGKRDGAGLRDFLSQHYSRLPRTTLRYAIEKFPEGERKRYLKGYFQ
jgi:3-methyladenine DNA glycosylase AlkD